MGQGHGPFKHKIQIKVTSTTLPQNLNSLTVKNMPAKWPIASRSSQGHFYKKNYLLHINDKKYHLFNATEL